MRGAVQRRAGLLAVSGGALLWGTTGVAVRIIHERTGLGPVAIGFLRLAVSAVFLAFLFGRSGLARIRASIGRHGWSLAVAGASLGLYQALYFIGVQDVGVSVSTLVSIAVAPVAVTIWTSVAARRLPSTASSATLVAALVGLALISLSTKASTSTAPHPLIGILASIGSGLGYGASTILNKRLAGGGDPLMLTAATSAVGAVVLLPWALAAGLWAPHDAIAIGWVIYIGVFSTAAAYGLYYLGMRSTAPDVAAVTTLLEPLAATVLAVAFLHESLAPLGILGGALMLLAIAALYIREPEPDAGPH